MCWNCSFKLNYCQSAKSAAVWLQAQWYICDRWKAYAGLSFKKWVITHQTCPAGGHCPCKILAVSKMYYKTGGICEASPGCPVTTQRPEQSIWERASFHWGLRGGLAVWEHHVRLTDIQCQCVLKGIAVCFNSTRSTHTVHSKLPRIEFPHRILFPSCWQIHADGSLPFQNINLVALCTLPMCTAYLSNTLKTWRQEHRMCRNSCQVWEHDLLLGHKLYRVDAWYGKYWIPW